MTIFKTVCVNSKCKLLQDNTIETCTLCGNRLSTIGTQEGKTMKVLKYENEILEIVDNRDNFTRSDLQGAIMAIVMNILSDNNN